MKKEKDPLPDFLMAIPEVAAVGLDDNGTIFVYLKKDTVAARAAISKLAGGRKVEIRKTSGPIRPAGRA